MAPSLMEIAGNNSTRGSTRVSQFTKEVARHAWSRKTREVMLSVTGEGPRCG
jgi:hypothetical protein